MNAIDFHTRPADPPHRRWLLWALLGLAGLITALHGRAVTYGLFMDDHVHYRQLRECGWSLADLTRACRLELIGGVIDLWWMPECTLRFFRPLAFGLMKLTYTLSGWSPAAMHVASLAWHLASCFLLTLLLRRLGATRWGAWAVAALFALHPGHVATVQWIASQTELIVTTLLLGALLCWAEFRGWPGGPAVGRGDRPPRPRWQFGAASAVLFALALGCRENAIMFPFVLMAVEPLVWRRRRRAALLLFAVFGVTIGVYLGLRWHLLGGAALPPRPYIVPPTDPDFLRYIFDKACYYLLGEFLFVPCVPIGGLAYFRERPLVFYGLTLLIVAVLAVLIVKNRHRTAGFLGPACLVGFMVPVLPAFESPHHLYLPGVGWAIMAALFFGQLGADESVPRRGTAKGRRAARRIIVVGTGLLFGIATFYFSLALDTAQAVEDRVVDEIATAPRPVQDHDVIYVANLPVIAHYVKLAVEERTGTRDLHVSALTWAPRLLGMATSSELIPIDDRTMEIRVADDRYFSGPLRLLIREAANGRTPDTEPQPVHHEHFTVEVLERDAEGVSALRFTFDRPLAQTGVHLFWGSRTLWAYQVLP